MKRSYRIVSAFVVTLILTYVSIFAVAEIFTEVVVLRTYDAQNLPHETRVTIIDRAETPWVRGRPYRSWFTQIEANPKAELYRDEVWRPVVGVVSRDPVDAEAFDQAMLETYGWAYRFVDFIARMSTNEIPVRLDPRSQ